MERNRWETAIRCLEIALHPNTSDAETVAAVNGFRRTAEGTPLRDICAAFAAADESDRVGVADRAKLQATVDRLTRENHALQEKLKIVASEQRAAARRLQDAEEQVRDLGDELRIAHRRAAAAQIRPPVSPFQEILAAAMDLRSESAGAPSFASVSRAPWTA